MIVPADRTQLFSEYYFSRKLREIHQLQAAGRSIINLGIGSPDLAPAEAVVAKLASTASNADVHGYQSYQGLPEFRQSIKDFYSNRYQATVQNLEVLPLMGSKEGITHVSMAFLNPGDQVLIPDLGYPTYTSVTRMVGATAIYYPLQEDSWEPDWSKLEELDTSKVKMMWLNYPHMPTGARGSLNLLKKLVDYAREREVLLCHDNPYSFIGNEHPYSIFNVEGAGDVAVELSSLSKTFNMAGWRVGWIVGDQQFLQPVLQIKSNMDSGMFRPVQEAAITALKLDNSWYEQLTKTYTTRRQLGEQIFDQLGCEYQSDQVGMFIWAKAPGNGEAFIEEILNKHDVFLAPGFIFGAMGVNYVRMSLCADESVLKEVLNRIK
ncbi:pyridoxal phosphate-dependent aminotransferase [Marinoscillum sp.]|uniref:pyridoxal phosphate-dependent aminotransferase n=1 Tax=Marinoscillum sp. TaxID=2024838 RepID=UPI003BA892CF